MVKTVISFSELGDPTTAMQMTAVEDEKPRPLPNHAVRKTQFSAVFRKAPQVVSAKVLALFRAIFWGEGVLKKEKKIESEVVVRQRDKTFRKTILRKVAARLPDVK